MPLPGRATLKSNVQLNLLLDASWDSLPAVSLAMVMILRQDVSGLLPRDSLVSDYCISPDQL
jgi:hypothetical protein